MDPEAQFWWTWWVRVATACATVAAVVVALFGDWLRARLFRPRLKLELLSAAGEASPAELQLPDGTRHTGMCRYYHVRLKNSASWPRATLAQVHLLRVETPGPDGGLQVRWSGDVPVKWRFHEIHPLQRTVGPPADCDLCSVIRGGTLQLHPLIIPLNLADFVVRDAPVDVLVSLQAISNEASSEIASFRIAWDGKWEDGELEMGRHLIIKQQRESEEVGGVP